MLAMIAVIVGAAAGPGPPSQAVLYQDPRNRSGRRACSAFSVPRGVSLSKSTSCGSRLFANNTPRIAVRRMNNTSHWFVFGLD